MSVALTSREQTTDRTHTPERPVEVSPATVPLEEVLGEIGRDARFEPGKYLNEVVVPFGGE